MPLTDTKIRNFKPIEKSYKVSDFEGLFLMIAPAGSKLWNLKCRIHGQEKKLSFGAYSTISLAQARKLKEEARTLLAQDIDPGEAKQEVLAELGVASPAQIARTFKWARTTAV